MATQKSTSFGKLKRPAGKEFRSGTLGEALDDLYADIDDAFEAIEKGAGYEPVKFASVSSIGQHGAGVYLVTKPSDSTVLTNDGAQARLQLDGQNTTTGDRVLIKDTHANSKEYQGIYTVTEQGDGSTNWVLTRAADMNETDDVVEGRMVLVTDGDTLANSTWRVNTKPTTLDTNDMDWVQVGSGTLAAGTLSADAAGRALMADDYFTTAEMVAGAGGKFAAGALDNTGIANVVADDAFTATEVSTAGAGGKFAANAITEAGADHLLTSKILSAGHFKAATPLTATVADMSASTANRPTALVAYTFVIADAAATTYSFDNWPVAVSIVDVVIRKTGGASGGDTIKIQTDVGGGMVDLFTAVNMGAADGDITHATTGWAPTQASMAVGDDLDIVIGGAAGNRACQVTLICVVS